MQISARILLPVATITAAITIIVGASFAFFSDSETSTGNNFTAGRLDLKIDGGDDTPQIVFFQDLKPGDNYIEEKDLFVDFNPAQVWLHLKGPSEQSPHDPISTQGNQTEPETLEENGVPKHDIENYITYDLQIDENTPIIAQEENVPFKDVFSCWIPLGQLPGNTHVNVQQSFHFDPAVTNWAQGDDITWTEEFYASQINDPSGPPPTGSGRVWNPNTKTCEPPEIIASCELEDSIFASSVLSSAQGLRKNGTAVLVDRTDPTDALGAPQSNGLPSDSPVVADSFFSLGFPHTNNGNVPGSITLDMGEAFYPNPSGADLFVYEVTGGVYPDETLTVQAKLNLGDSWTTLGNVTRDGGIELGILSSARYVQLTEASNIAPFEATADGYDLDAVKAFCTAVN